MTAVQAPAAAAALAFNGFSYLEPLEGLLERSDPHRRTRPPAAGDTAIDRPAFLLFSFTEATHRRLHHRRFGTALTIQLCAVTCQTATP